MTANRQGRAGQPRQGVQAPCIWLLTGHRTGDNAQVRALGELVVAKAAEHLPCTPMLEEKPLAWSAVRALPNALLPPTLQVLSLQARARIKPPWPDLVIGVGRRAVPVARWIRQRNRAARIVWLGRPRAPLHWFDLLLTTPQYGLPEDAPNVVMLDLPPAQPPAADEEVLEHWQRQLAHLPRPWIGVLVGGARWPLLFDATDAARLGQAVEQLRAQAGGSWIISTSPRTGVRQARALHEALRQPGWFHYWRNGASAHDPLRNPHQALLALADCFVVTADSASLLAEAVRSGKPVHIWPMRRSPLVPRWRADAGIMRQLAASGLLSPPRDMQHFARRLVRAGRARWLKPQEDDDVDKAATAPCTATASGLRETALEEAVARIASWLAER